MVFIQKGPAPASLTSYLATNPTATYDNLKSNKNIKIDIYNSLIAEQYGLCAYCMTRILYNPITDRNIQIEHYIPQSDSTLVAGSSQTLGQIKSLDYTNMLGVCDGGKQYNKDNSLSGLENLSCDAHRGNTPLTINPLDNSFFSPRAFEYKNSGEIDSANSVIKTDLVDTLHLNVLRLVSLRKQAMNKVVTMISKGQITSANKAQRITELKTPKNGQLEAFFDFSVFFIDKLV